MGNQIQSLGGSDSFNAYTIDAELTKGFCRRGWNLLGTFGVRYGEYDHARNNSVFGAVNGDIFALSSLQNEGFHGTGLTFSLSGLKPLKRHPCMSLYLSGRGSTLFGDARTLAIASSSFAGPAGNAQSVNGALDDRDETLFIGEIQAGLQWSRCVRSFNGRMFARVGFEYQYWGTTDGNALAVAASGTGGSSLGQVAVRGGNQNVDLVGFNVMTGFAW